MNWSLNSWGMMNTWIKFLGLIAIHYAFIMACYGKPMQSISFSLIYFLCALSEITINWKGKKD